MANQNLLATPRKFSMQGAFEILLRKPADDSIVAYLTDVKTSSLENTMEMVYPTGGRGNVYIGGGFAHSRRATMNVTVATFNTEVMAVQNGTEVYDGSTEVTKYDVISADAQGKYFTTYTAIGDVGNEIKFVYIVGNNGTYSKTYTQAAVASTGSFAYSTETKEVTFAEGDGPAAGERIACSYDFRSASNAQKIVIEAGSIPDTVYAVAYGLAKDQCTGELFPCQVRGQAQIDGNWNFDLSADGEPIVQSLNLEFVKGCINDTLYEFIVYTEDEEELPPETITLSVPTGDLLGVDASKLGSYTIDEFGKVEGSLNYVENYTGFSSVTTEQNGYYFAFKVEVPAEHTGAIATMQGSGAPVNLDLSDGIGIMFMGADAATAQGKTVTLSIDWDGEGTAYPHETLVFDTSALVYNPKA